jgi:hypothetical protein
MADAVEFTPSKPSFTFNPDEVDSVCDFVPQAAVVHATFTHKPNVRQTKQKHRDNHSPMITLRADTAEFVPFLAKPAISSEDYPSLVADPAILPETKVWGKGDVARIKVPPPVQKPKVPQMTLEAKPKIKVTEKPTKNPEASKQGDEPEPTSGEDLGTTAGAPCATTLELASLREPTPTAHSQTASSGREVPADVEVTSEAPEAKEEETKADDKEETKKSVDTLDSEAEDQASLPTQPDNTKPDIQEAAMQLERPGHPTQQKSLVVEEAVKAIEEESKEVRRPFTYSMATILLVKQVRPMQRVEAHERTDHIHILASRPIKVFKLKAIKGGKQKKNQEIWEETLEGSIRRAEIPQEQMMLKEKAKQHTERRLAEVAEDVKLKRKVKITLNKLAPTNFDKLKAELSEIIKNGRDLVKELAQLIFDKAWSEVRYSSMYANLCSYINQQYGEFEFGAESTDTQRNKNVRDM